MKTPHGITDKTTSMCYLYHDSVSSSNNTTTENAVPHENITPSSLPPNTFQTRSGRISKPPERL